VRRELTFVVVVRSVTRESSHLYCSEISEERAYICSCSETSEERELTFVVGVRSVRRELTFVVGVRSVRREGLY